MHSDLIGKIAKARLYAQEPERVALAELRAHFHGGNNEHELVLDGGHWHCTCDFFRSHGTCAHTMALQQIFRPMLRDHALDAAEDVSAESPVHTHMHSDLIGKIEKARRYAEERNRIIIRRINAQFHGGNNEHQMTLDENRWSCSCDFFRLRDTCSHVMALQQILQPMLPEAALDTGTQNAMAERLAAIG